MNNSENLMSEKIVKFNDLAIEWSKTLTDTEYKKIIGSTNNSELIPIFFRLNDTNSVEKFSVYQKTKKYLQENIDNNIHNYSGPIISNFDDNEYFIVEHASYKYYVLFEKHIHNNLGTHDLKISLMKEYDKPAKKVWIVNKVQHATIILEFLSAKFNFKFENIDDMLIR